MKQNNKHAYCIICHNEPKLLSNLIAFLDNERNDIFLMVDKKTDMGIYKGIRAHKAGMFFAERIDVKWGDISLIKAEYAVFECARSHGVYSRYHLISGVDMPIKSQDYIHRFFDANPDVECISFSHEEQDEDDLRRKTSHYAFFLHHAKSRRKIVREMVFMINLISYRLYKTLHLKRTYPYTTLKKGTNWVSITNNLVEYLLSKKEEMLRNFNYILAADEIYKQTIVWNSSFRNKVYMLENEYESCLRAIDWQRGSPYCWGEDGITDVALLRTSKAIFARKFSSKNMWIVEEIKKIIKERGGERDESV